MRNLFTAADVLRFRQSERVTYCSETRGGKRLILTCGLDGLSYSVEHGTDRLYSGCDLDEAIAAYDNA